MKRRKDNLTDFIEQMPDVDENDAQEPDKDRRVYNSEGELITLSRDSSKKRRSHTKGKVLELSLNDIEKIVDRDVKKALDEFADLVVKKVKEKLAEF